MPVPPMYIVNCTVSWFIVVLSVAAFFYVRRKTGQGWVFWPLRAVSWIMFAASHSMLLAGVSANEWYLTLLRILGYAFQVGALFNLIIEKVAKFQQVARMARRVKPGQE
jgi:hypothetical protein